MSVAGDHILTVLRINGKDCYSLTLHPNLLAGPFVIGGLRYTVTGQHVDRVGSGPRPLRVDENGEAVLRMDPPEWAVVLELSSVDYEFDPVLPTDSESAS